MTVDFGLAVQAARMDARHSSSCPPSVGRKEKALEVLPPYAAGRLGGNQNFINQSSTLTIGPAEGTVIVVLGTQPGAPVVDLHLLAR